MKMDAIAKDTKTIKYAVTVEATLGEWLYVKEGIDAAKADREKYHWQRNKFLNEFADAIDVIIGRWNERAIETISFSETETNR